jgi:uncharacterized membrane protein (UPF0127 family)
MRALGILLVLLALVLVGCDDGAADPGGGSPGTPSEPRAEAPTTEGGEELRKVIIDASSGEKVKVRVEIADNYTEWVIGLRWRKSLPENQGMLFVYPDEEPRTFTMEDTLIPLSVAFMDSEGRIVDIQDMEPSKEGYDSARPARYALEVNQGFFEVRGVEVGDRAELPE